MGQLAHVLGALVAIQDRRIRAEVEARHALTECAVSEQEKGHPGGRPFSSGLMLNLLSQRLVGRQVEDEAPGAEEYGIPGLSSR